MPPDVTAGIVWLRTEIRRIGLLCRTSTTWLGKYIISDRPMTEEDFSHDQTYRRLLDRPGARGAVE